MAACAEKKQPVPFSNGEEVPTEILVEIGWNVEKNKMNPICNQKKSYA